MSRRLPSLASRHDLPLRWHSLSQSRHLSSLAAASRSSPRSSSTKIGAETRTRTAEPANGPGSSTTPPRYRRGPEHRPVPRTRLRHLGGVGELLGRSFSLTSPITEVENNGTFAGATPFTVGDVLRGGIGGSSDEDLFRFSGLQGQTVVISGDSASTGTSLNMRLICDQDTTDFWILEGDAVLPAGSPGDRSARRSISYELLLAALALFLLDLVIRKLPRRTPTQSKRGSGDRAD